jgi:hypothetical protein
MREQIQKKERQRTLFQQKTAVRTIYACTSQMQGVAF